MCTQVQTEWSVPDIGLVTTSGNRTPWLVRAAKTWVQYPFAEIIVVDWGSSTPITYQHLPDDPRIKIYRCEERKWSAPKAMGCAVRLSTSPMVLKLDSDTRVVGTIPLSVPHAGDFYRGVPNKSAEHGHLYGATLFPRVLYDAVNGYHERLIGWGHEDTDLYSRMAAHPLGGNKVRLQAGVLEHISHDKSVSSKGAMFQNFEMTRNHPWTSDDTPYDLTLIEYRPR